MSQRTLFFPSLKDIPWIALTIVIVALQIFTASAEAQEHEPAKNDKTGCTTCDLAGIDATAQPTLKIRWKRLVDQSGHTATIHDTAEKELDLAFAALNSALTPLGVKVVLEKAGLTEDQFQQNPLNSNRIWLNGTALEMYLPESETGQVQDEQTRTTLRTVSFGGAEFNEIPANMIVHAGLIAAANSVQQTMADVHAIGLVASNGKSCCSQGARGQSCCAQEDASSSCRVQTGTEELSSKSKTEPEASNKK